MSFAFSRPRWGATLSLGEVSVKVARLPVGLVVHAFVLVEAPLCVLLCLIALATH